MKNALPTSPEAPPEQAGASNPTKVMAEHSELEHDPVTGQSDIHETLSRNYITDLEAKVRALEHSQKMLSLKYFNSGGKNIE